MEIKKCVTVLQIHFIIASSKLLDLSPFQFILVLPRLQSR